MIRAAALDRMPEPKLGWKASAMERRGEKTDRGDQLRAVQKQNTERSRKLNPADYPYGIFSPSGQIPRMLWTLNNHDALLREADSPGMEVFA